MTIKEMKEEDKIILEVEGRIDTNTSTQLQSEVLKALQKTNTLLIDLAQTDYVSSAGLRIFLIAYKTASAKNGSFRLKNVGKGIMEILNHSGFLKFLEIES